MIAMIALTIENDQEGKFVEAEVVVDNKKPLRFDNPFKFAEWAASQTALCYLVEWNGDSPTELPNFQISRIRVNPAT